MHLPQTLDGELLSKLEPHLKQLLVFFLKFMAQASHKSSECLQLKLHKMQVGGNRQSCIILNQLFTIYFFLG